MAAETALLDGREQGLPTDCGNLPPAGQVGIEAHGATGTRPVEETGRPERSGGCAHPLDPAVPETEPDRPPVCWSIWREMVSTHGLGVDTVPTTVLPFSPVTDPV